MPKTNVKVSLVNRDGNVFHIIGQTQKALSKAGHKDLAQEYRDKCFAADSYDEVLRLTMEYVDVT